MTVPARENAAGQEQAGPEGRPAAGTLFWADAHAAVTASARTAAMMTAELGRDPGNGAAMAMAGLLAGALTSLAGITGQLLGAEQGRVLDEAVLAAERKKSYDQGVADTKAGRCRLAAVPDA